jgi:hypothetical protein
MDEAAMVKEKGMGPYATQVLLERVATVVLYVSFVFISFINFKSSDLHLRRSNGLEAYAASVHLYLALQMSPHITIHSAPLSRIYVSVDVL